MVFKIDFDKIVDGLTKNFTKDIPSSINNVLRTELEKHTDQVKTQQECDNLASLKDGLDIKKRKTKVSTIPKIKKTDIKKLIPKDGYVSEPTDENIISRIQDKELSINPENKNDNKFQFKKPSTEIISMGRRLISVDASIFNSDYAKYLKSNPLKTNDSYIGDSLRGRAGKFWSIDSNSKNFLFIGNNSPAKLYKFGFHETLDDDEVSDFGRTFQILSLESNVNNFVNAQKKYSKSLWTSFIHGTKYAGSTLHDQKLDFTFESTIKEDQIFFDHAFEMSLPFSMKEIEHVPGTNGILSAQIEPRYNFFIEDYETSIQNKNVLENTLPNMYVMLSEMNSTNPNPEFKKMISLDGIIKTDTKKLLTFTKKGVQTKVSRVYDLKTNPVGEYFDLFGRQYQEAVKANTVKNINNKFSNIGISIDDLSIIKNYSNKEELFPMNVSIRFSTDKTTTFTNILKDTSLLDTFQSKIINKISANKSEQFISENAIEEITQKEFDTAKKQVSFSATNNKMWDLAEIIQDLQEDKEPLINNAVYLGEHDITQKADNRAEFKFFRSLNATIFQSKLQTLIKQKFRNFKDIVDGKLSYSETVLYRIAKFIGTDTNGQPIQNIFIPNDSNLDILEYIDTQVKYDKRYTYVIYAYQMVMGNKYWYSDLKTDEYEHHASLRVYQEPSLKLVEVPYYSFVARIVDKPPAPPDINFIGYKGIDNKFLILFNNSVIDLKTQPIKIKESDQGEFDKIREAQLLKSTEPISYGGDDRIAQYEVYRLLEKPASYGDFQNSLRKIVNTDVNSATSQKATSAGFVDMVEPNKKYWYVFRSVDIHGHISNPTSLYEVEIINEHGTIFQIVNVVDFKPAFEKEPSKTMKRFVQIVPTVLQSLIDEKSSGFANAKSAEDIKNKIALSLADEKLWGKTFRIRMISRNTGKKIDFDINFQHQKITRVKVE